MIGTLLVAKYVNLDDPQETVHTSIWDLWIYGMDIAMLHHQNLLGLNPHVRVLSVATELED